jgi:hypothetical protein
VMIFFWFLLMPSPKISKLAFAGSEAIFLI